MAVFNCFHWDQWFDNCHSSRVWKVLVMHVPKLLPDCAVKVSTITWYLMLADIDPTSDFLTDHPTTDE